MGAITSSIEMFEITMPSMFEPSADSIAMPPSGRRPESRRSITQLLTVTSFKSPAVSVPNLKLLHDVRNTQLATTRCSVARRFPNAMLALGQTASSQASM